MAEDDRGNDILDWPADEQLSLASSAYKLFPDWQLDKLDDQHRFYVPFDWRWAITVLVAWAIGIGIGIAIGIALR